MATSKDLFFHLSFLLRARFDYLGPFRQPVSNPAPFSICKRAQKGKRGASPSLLILNPQTEKRGAVFVVVAAMSLLSKEEQKVASKSAGPPAKPCSFRVRVHSVSVSDLRTRHRFGEELRAAFRFQQDPEAGGSGMKPKKRLLKKKFSTRSAAAPLSSGTSAWERVVKTEYRPSHGGDCQWASREKFVLTTPFHSVSNVSEWLRDHHVSVHVYCKHDAKQNKKFGGGNGSVEIDLFTIATGPAKHNLPLKNSADETLGRVEFTIEMQQETSVGCSLSEVKARNLTSVREVSGMGMKYVFS
jgi:hypothetical protein